MYSLCTNIPPSPLRRPLPVKWTYPYFKFGRLNAADLNKKPIQIQRQTLRTDLPHRMAMGTKLAVAFSVIFIPHVWETTTACESFLWKIFTDDIFSAWTLPETEINNFIDFANSSHSTIKFTLVKTDCFPWQWSQTHFKPTETFQETHFSSFYLLRKGFVYGEVLCFLRTNSVKK